MAFPVENPWSGAAAGWLRLLSAASPAGAVSSVGGAGPVPGWVAALAGQSQGVSDVFGSPGAGGGTPPVLPPGPNLPPSVTGGPPPPNGPYPTPVGGSFAPFGGANADSPPAWLAKNALAAFQSGNTAYMTHLLSDPTIAGNPHLANFIKGLFAGDAGRLAEAKYYATNPSYNGWNNAAGDGIAGDGR